MVVQPVSTLIEEQPSLRHLARTLGLTCLEHAHAIVAARASHSTSNIMDTLTATVAAVPIDLWLGDGEGALAGTLDILGELLDLVEGAPELAHHAVLRGLCRTALHEWFEGVDTEVELVRGDPFPVPRRPTNTAILGVTPYIETMDEGHLLSGTGFRLHQPFDTPGLRVVLDFTDRAALDADTWFDRPGQRNLPRIATVHPWASSDDLTVGTRLPDYWFDVRPTTWGDQQAAAVIDQLRAAKDAGADIAVLPELSLPEPGCLAALIEGSWTELPSIIVAGSAHHADGELRANTAVTYLRGKELFRHDKVHPFFTRYLGPHIDPYDDPTPEGITTGVKTLRIVASSNTRLGVVICADINDVGIPALLEHLYVNILLVPALTPSAGAFNAAATGIAARCQGIVAIVNGTPPIDPASAMSADPFLLLVAAPRPTPEDQSRAFSAPGGARRAVGVFDPHELMDDAVSWCP